MLGKEAEETAYGINPRFTNFSSKALTKKAECSSLSRTCFVYLFKGSFFSSENSAGWLCMYVLGMGVSKMESI